VTTRQLLEDVQASLHDSIAGEAILKCYTEETRQQFAAVIRTIIESSLAQALATSQKQMDGWLKGALDGAIRNAQDALAAVTRDFRVKLLGAWSYLLWSVFRLAGPSNVFLMRLWDCFCSSCGHITRLLVTG
jgi:citrate lyase gamma subunit